MMNSTRRFFWRRPAESFGAIGWRLAEPAGLETIVVDAALDERRLHRACALLGEPLVERVVADVVGVALDARAS